MTVDQVENTQTENESSEQYRRKSHDRTFQFAGAILESGDLVCLHLQQQILGATIESLLFAAQRRLCGLGLLARGAKIDQVLVKSKKPGEGPGDQRNPFLLRRMLR